MNKLSLLWVLAAGLVFLVSCRTRQAGENQETVVPKAMVKITRPVKGDIEDKLMLNGKTVFLKKNLVVSPISGYIIVLNVKFGDKVQAGSVLFEIQTRENKALQQTDNSAGNFGKISVQATTSGVVNEPVIVGVGAYVTEGSPLCTIVDNNDLLVQVNVPYENHSLVKQGTRCRMFLPDNSQIEGFVFQIRPFVNETTQTQEVLIKPAGFHPLPENMNLTAEFLKTANSGVLLLPKSALLTNETQEEFWVMKVLDDSLAVIVPVEIGIKNDSLAEIRSSGLTVDDIIILEGGYGLEDSSLVNIVKEP